MHVLRSFNEGGSFERFIYLICEICVARRGVARQSEDGSADNLEPYTLYPVPLIIHNN